MFPKGPGGYEFFLEPLLFPAGGSGRFPFPSRVFFPPSRAGDGGSPPSPSPAYATDPEVARYVLWDPHRSLADTRAFLRDLRARARRGYPSSWAVVLKETGAVIGTIGFIWYSTDNRSAELGYSFSRQYWNHGYATQALRAVCRECFRSLPLNRLEAQYDLRNPASGRVMEHAGFRREGVLRERILNKGEYVDVALCSLLRSDLPASP